MMNELRIGGYKADTIQGLNINITKEVYSIVDPSARKSDFTKTVSIPGSKVNDNIFASLFDVNFSIRSATQLNPDFNPSKKASCEYLQDSFSQIKGYCQLESIVVLENNKVVYNIVIHGSSRTLFSDIANLTLNDLTTLGTAVWDDASIVDSWTDTFLASIKPCYPYLNRGKAVYNRFGSNQEWSYAADAFKPWMYVKHIVNSIIAEAGYTTDIAQFFETEQFCRLIMECDVKKFQQDQAAIAATLVDAQRNSTQAIVPVANINQGNMALIWDKQLIFSTENSDPAGQYDPTTGTLTMTVPGYTNLECTFTGTVNKGTAAAGNMQFILCRKRAGAYYFLDSVGSAVSGSGAQVLSAPVVLSVQGYQAEVGDEIRVLLGNFLLATGFIDNSNITNFILSASNNYFRESVDGQVSYGQTFDIASVLPSMKQKDFLMGVFKIFNIYVDTLPEDSLILEPRDDYFTDDVVKWTDKLDKSKDFKIVPQGLLVNKEILFTYQSNDCDLARNYQQSTGYKYGYKRLLFDNDFVKEKKELELPFSICPLITDTDFGNVNMVTLFDGVGAEKSNKPIIAYYGNMKAGRMVYWDQTPTRTEYTTYPFAGPIDDILSPNYSLEFDTQDFYFYSVGNAINLTDNNAFNQFHRTQWEEIGHRDSKLIEAYFELNADDICHLSFRPLYWIEKAYYRLLEVQDYNPDGKSTTLCRFLKLNIYTPAAPVVTTMEGGNGQGGGTGDILKWTKDGKLQGAGNTVHDNSSGVVVTGYGNSVGPGSINITIHGSNNTIMPDVSNIILINSDDLVISESNQLYINGVKYDVGTLTDGYVMTYDLATNTISLQAPTGGGGGLVDGDYGDVTVSGTGTVITINAKKVTLAKMDDVVTGSVFYRKTAGTGVPEVQDILILKADLGLSGTNTGDQSLAGLQPLDSDLTTIAGLTATSDNFMQAKAGAWASRTVAQVKVDLLLTGTNSGDETATTVGALVNAAGAATPNNGDFVATAESGGLLKKITWTNVKAFLKTYFDTIYQAVITGFTFTSNADGGQISAGTAARILKWLGADITLTGSGTATMTFPSVSDTIVGNKSDPAAKCWAKVSGDGTNILASFNITSITDTAPGDLTITIATDFSTANWSALATVERINSTTTVTNAKKVNIKAGTQAAGSIALQCWDSTATNNVVEDPANYHFVGFGVQ